MVEEQILNELVTIIENNISNNNRAVKVQGSTYITLEKNHISMNDLYGFLLSNSFYCRHYRKLFIY